MKKILTSILVLSLIALFVVGCGSGQNATAENNSDKSKLITIKIGASSVPHAEILNAVKPILEKDGIKLDIIEFADYNQPNLRLADKDLDANYFQHIPYLESFSKDHNLDLTYTAKVHIEPMGVYSEKVKNLKNLKEGAEIAIPNDPTNAGRALIILEQAGLLKIKDGVGINATVYDITENPEKLKSPNWKQLPCQGFCKMWMQLLLILIMLWRQSVSTKDSWLLNLLQTILCKYFSYSQR